MDFISMLKEKASKLKRTIVLPEGDSPAVLEAACRLESQGLARPVVLGAPADIRKNLENLHMDPETISVVDMGDEDKLTEYAASYSGISGLTDRVCRRMLREPLNYAAMMVSKGEADGMVAGINCPTGDVILASEMFIGLDDEISVPSSFYLMDVPGYSGTEGSMIVVADPAVNPNPTSRQLADIAMATAQSVVSLLGWIPRVAMLSFSTKGSADHPDVEKVTEAVRLAQDTDPSLLIDGELQADAALIEKVAQKKTDGTSPVAGKANILIFPDLDAANIGSKLMQIFAHSSVYGPILQGFKKPVSDLSRNATAEDVFNTVLFVASR